MAKSIDLDGSLGRTMTMYLRGCTGATVGGLKLVISNIGPTGSYHDFIGSGVSLYIEGAWQRTSSKIPLSMRYTKGIDTHMLPLATRGMRPGMNSYLNLYISSTTHSHTGGLPLFIKNIGIGNQTSLYIRGTGVFNDYKVTSASAQLFLQRMNTAAGIVPLRMKALDFASNSWLPMFLKHESVTNLQAGLPFFIEGDYIWSDSPNSYLHMFLAANVKQERGLNLFIQNTPNTHGYIPLVLMNLGGHPNSYMNLCLKCSGVPANAGIDLRIRYVKALLNDSIPLSTHGY